MRAITHPSSDPSLDTVLHSYRESVPTLWLLGKTGAGKSSIVQRLTGDPKSIVGNGFEPCTRFASTYSFPEAQPVVRFLDTRGLGEAGYDPLVDIDACKENSHALLIVSRVDDTELSALNNALTVIATSRSRPPALLVHTALHSISDPSTLSRAIRFNQQRIEQAFGTSLTSVNIDFTAPEDHITPQTQGLDALVDALSELLPTLYPLLHKESADSDEQMLFLSRRAEVLGYAGASGAADLMPAVGVVAVPTLQGKMLHALAARYDIAWNSRIATEFLAALGTSFLYRYALSLMGRQIGKFIPIYGQTAGAAAAASISFASTYALGRVACLYFYRRKHQQSIDTDELQRTFRQAFSRSRTEARTTSDPLADHPDVNGDAR